MLNKKKVKIIATTFGGTLARHGVRHGRRRNRADDTLAARAKYKAPGWSSGGPARSGQRPEWSRGGIDLGRCGYREKGGGWEKRAPGGRFCVGRMCQSPTWRLHGHAQRFLGEIRDVSESNVAVARTPPKIPRRRNSNVQTSPWPFDASH